MRGRHREYIIWCLPSMIDIIQVSPRSQKLLVDIKLRNKQGFIGYDLY